MAHLGTKQVSLNCRVAKWIDLPTSSRSFIELLLYKTMPQSGLIYHVYVVTRGFVVHTPSSVAADTQIYLHDTFINASNMVFFSNKTHQSEEHKQGVQKYKKLMSHAHLHEFQLTIIYQFSHLFLRFWALFYPPSMEESLSF